MDAFCALIKIEEKMLVHSLKLFFFFLVLLLIFNLYFYNVGFLFLCLHTRFISPFLLVLKNHKTILLNYIYSIN
jgi:hypothetical protein